jgi:glutaredoxin
LTLITVYSKDGCHLCDDAIARLRKIQAELGFELAVVDIATDEAIHRAYFERIPVITLDGEELFDYFVDEAILRDRLAQRLGHGRQPEAEPEHPLESSR